MREKLINAIIDMAGDELESTSDLILLAKDSEEQLVDRLISIAEYYKTLEDH